MGNNKQRYFNKEWSDKMFQPERSGLKEVSDNPCKAVFSVSKVRLLE